MSYEVNIVVIDMPWDLGDVVVPDDGDLRPLELSPTGITVILLIILEPQCIFNYNSMESVFFSSKLH